MPVKILTLSLDASLKRPSPDYMIVHLYSVFVYCIEEKKENILLGHMTKAPLPTENLKVTTQNTKLYTSIAE